MLKSPTAIDIAPNADGNVGGVPNPPEPSPRATETVLKPKLATAMSAFVSLLKSAKTTAAGASDGIVRFEENSWPEQPIANETPARRVEPTRSVENLYTVNSITTHLSEFE
jgi:hypothetical protein